MSLEPVEAWEVANSSFQWFAWFYSFTPGSVGSLIRLIYEIVHGEGQSWQQEWEAVGHIVSTIRKQEVVGGLSINASSPLPTSSKEVPPPKGSATFSNNTTS